MVGDAADQSLENSPGRRVDLIFERMDRVSFSIFKDTSDQNHFIFEINFGKRRIRHTTTLKLNSEFLDWLKID